MFVNIAYKIEFLDLLDVIRSEYFKNTTFSLKFY